MACFIMYFTPFWVHKSLLEATRPSPASRRIKVTAPSSCSLEWYLSPCHTCGKTMWDRREQQWPKAELHRKKIGFQKGMLISKMRTEKRLGIGEQWGAPEQGLTQVSGREGKTGTRNESSLRLQPERKHDKLTFDRGWRQAESMWREGGCS